MIEEIRKVYEFDEFRLDAAKRQLLREGEVVPLYSKAFDLLLLLVQSNGRDLSKDVILETIWPDQILEESNLTVNISAVRRALGEKAAQPRYLVTIPGRGYRFVAQVREAQDGNDGVLIETQTISQVTVEQVSEDTNDAIEVARPPALLSARASRSDYIINGIKQHKLAAVICVMVIAVGVVGLSFYLRSRKPEAAIESIAVLPFVNTNGDPNTDYLSDGVTESIINSFSRLPRLRVVPRSIVFRYKGQQIDPQEMGHKLGVRAVLTGRVVQRGDKINIQAELVDVERNSELWGEQYDRAIADLQSVQTDISNQIVGSLRLRLSGEEQQQLKEKHTPPPEAYQAYLKGRHFFDQATEDSCNKAIDFFNQAIRTDPKYALAYADLADVYTEISNRYVSPLEAMPKAKDATLKALALDGSLAHAHLALAKIHWFTDWDFPGAEEEFKRAVELNPNEPNTYAPYGEFLGCTLERFDEGIALENRALQLDSVSLANHISAANLFKCSRQYDNLIEEAKKIIELDPRAGHVYLGRAYLQKGLYEQGLAEIQKGVDARNGGSGTLGCAYALAGRRSEALKVVADLEILAKQRYLSSYTILIVYAALGDKNNAFRLLEKEFAERNDGLPEIKTDPSLDNLRSDPRFSDLLRRIGLPQ